MRAECAPRAAQRRLPLRERPSPGVREHPGREPRTDPDRPSLWRGEHPCSRRSGDRTPGSPFLRARLQRGERPVFQSSFMQNPSDPSDSTDPPRAPSTVLPEGAYTFASLVRHELVNPLNALSGWLHLLSIRPTVSEEIAHKALEGARRALAQQLGQVEMLSRLLHLAEPGARLDTEPVSFAELVSQCSQGAGLAGRAVFLLQRPPSDVSQWSFQVRAHEQALSAVVTLLLRHVAEQADPQTRVRVEVAVQAGEVSMTVWCAPEMPESAHALALPFADSSASRTRSLEWLHALAVIRALQAHVDLLKAQGNEVGLRLRMPSHGLEGVR